MADAEMPAARTIGIIAKPLAIKLAQTVGLTTTAFLAGQTAASTYVLLPNILKSPAPLLSRQVRETDEKQRTVSATSSLALSALFGYLAYREPKITTRAFKFYALAAVLLPSTLPFNYFFVRPLTHTLYAREQAYYPDSYTTSHISTSTPSLPPDPAASSTVLVDHPPTSSTASHASSEYPDNASVATVSDQHAEYQSMSAKEMVHTLRRGVNDELSVHQLAEKWGWYNLVRAGIVGVSAAAGMWAVVSEDLSFFELF